MMASGRSDLWIPAKLTIEQATMVLACVSDVVITDNRQGQREFFVWLSKAYEKRWPDSYTRAINGGVFPDWREFWLDTMSEEEKRQAALCTIMGQTEATRDPDGCEGWL